MIKYEELKNPEEDSPPQEEEVPETARLLDETARFVGDHLVADERVIRVCTLFGAATHAMPQAFVTFPHLAFMSRKPGLEGRKSGKTTGMKVTASISANPKSAKGTYAALRNRLLAVPSGSVATFWRDQVDALYGLNGLNRGGNPVFTEFAQEGYQKGATDSVSRQGTDFEFSLFHPLIMTANATGLAPDIVQRSVVAFMEPGTPERYFSVRESKAEADSLSAALNAAAKAHLDDITAFRARGAHPMLTQRLLEVWEPLFAVAKVLGGQRWLNWCLDAFTYLGLETEVSALSPVQQILRDVVLTLNRPPVNSHGNAQVQFLLPSGQMVAQGIVLADELKRAYPENDIYASKTVLGISGLIADAMHEVVHVGPKQVRVGKERYSVYSTDDIDKAWEAVRPPDLGDAKIDEEPNPFAVTAVSDEDFDEVFEIPPKASSVNGVKDVSDGKATVITRAGKVRK